MELKENGNDYRPRSSTMPTEVLRRLRIGTVKKNQRKHLNSESSDYPNSPSSSHQEYLTRGRTPDSGKYGQTESLYASNDFLSSSKDTLEVPGAKRIPRKQSKILATDESPFGSQSPNISEYFDACMKGLINQSLLVSREPMPKGSRTFEQTLDAEKPVSKSKSGKSLSFKSDTKGLAASVPKGHGYI